MIVPTRLEELLYRIRWRVCHIQHVLVPHRERAGQEERIRVLQVQLIDDRHEIALRRQIAARRKLCYELGWLEAQQEDAGRIGTVIEKPAGFCDGLFKRDSRRIEGDLRVASRFRQTP